MSNELVRHWSEVIAQEVIERKQEPFVVASGITTSGPTHMGTACEFLYPSALVKYLRDEGYKTDFVFIGDIMDAFDSVPQPLKKFTFLEEHLGKPLCDVPDPYECCKSYGDHFLNEASNLMERLEVRPRILRANDLFRSGRYDEYARLFHERLPDVKAIAQETAEMSGVRGLPEWMDVVMPVCEYCGKIATTVVEYFDGNLIRYSCTRDVGYAKGCGYKGEMKISDHNYKIFWRLDWPSRQDFLKVSAELAGVDHHTRGGSWDTAVAVHKRIFGREPPVGCRYGFVMLHGRKYSKSKGIGIGVQELLELVPPELIKYALFKPDIGENKEFDASGHRLIRLYEEYQQAANLFESGGMLRRAENKMVLAYSLTTDERPWRAEFTDVLTFYQIYRDWDRVADKVGDREGVFYLKKYVENWVESEYLPEEYVFRFSPTRVDVLNREIATFAERLDASMGAEDIHNLVYEVAMEFGVKPPKFFRALYMSLIERDHGPRFGKLVVAIGVSQVKETLLKLYAANSG